METVTARQCATEWDVSESRARRILAPLKPVERNTETGAMLYDKAEANAAHAAQPGRGTRSDRTTAPLTDEQFEQLITDDSIPATHRALWSLLRDGDARITEALVLNVPDVNLDQHTAHLDYRKRRSDPRTIPISERTADLLRQAKGDRDAGPLFTGTRGRPLGRETAARVARHAGAGSIHAFRPRPHTVGSPPRSGTVQTPAREVQVGDVIHLDNGRSIQVQTVEQVASPSGPGGVQVNSGAERPVFVAADAVLTIAERDEA